MDELTKCPVCHVEVKPTDYFCFNCGKDLKPAPLSIRINKQIVVYLGSLFLPPYGIIVGLRYLRENNPKAKIVGIIAFILTVISLIVSIRLLTNLIANVNSQVNTQMQLFSGF